MKWLWTYLLNVRKISTRAQRLTNVISIACVAGGFRRWGRGLWGSDWTWQSEKACVKLANGGGERFFLSPPPFARFRSASRQLFPLPFSRPLFRLATFRSTSNLSTPTPKSGSYAGYYFKGCFLNKFHNCASFQNLKANSWEPWRLILVLVLVLTLTRIRSF